MAGEGAGVIEQEADQARGPGRTPMQEYVYQDIFPISPLAES